MVTIGKFFAVNRGHQAWIRSACRQAQSLALPAVVLTFNRHPQEVLKPGRQLPILASLEERLDLFEQLGADIAVVMSTTRKFLSLSPEEFVERCLDLVGPIDVGDKTRAGLLNYATSGGALRFDSESEREQSAARIGRMLQLIAASREYQFA